MPPYINNWIYMTVDATVQGQHCENTISVQGPSAIPAIDECSSAAAAWHGVLVANSTKWSTLTTFNFIRSDAKAGAGGVSYVYDLAGLVGTGFNSFVPLQTAARTTFYTGDGSGESYRGGNSSFGKMSQDLQDAGHWNAASMSAEVAYYEDLKAAFSVLGYPWVIASRSLLELHPVNTFITHAELRTVKKRQFGRGI